MVDDSRSSAPARSSIAAREPRVRLRWLPGALAYWSLAAVAMALDIALTGLGLSMGLVERNVLARAFIAEFGLLGAGVLLKGFALGVGYAGWRLLPVIAPDIGRHRYLVPLGLALPSWVAVGINTATILAIR